MEEHRRQDVLEIEIKPAYRKFHQRIPVNHNPITRQRVKPDIRKDQDASRDRQAFGRIFRTNGQKHRQTQGPPFITESKT